LGFNRDAFASMDYAGRKKYAKSLMETYKTLQGESLGGGEQQAWYMLSNGASVKVEAAWTQDARESARRYGLDERNFLEATDQFNRNFEESNKQAWMQMKGYDGESAEDATTMTQGYRAWKSGQKDLEEMNRKRDLIWQGFINDALNKSGPTLSKFDVKSAGYKYRHLGKGAGNPEQVDAIMKEFFDTYGYEPQRAEIVGILRNESPNYVGVIDVKGFGTGQEFEEEFSRLNNAIEGHGLQITQAMSGWQAAGQVFGQVLSAGATVGAAYAGRPSV
jgi:hypothetical protein